MKYEDICYGADPFVFEENGSFCLVLSDNPFAHDGISGYTIRKATTVEGLIDAVPFNLDVLPQSNNLRQPWAAEIHSDHLYVATSNGDNYTHRMHVYQSTSLGLWKELGPLVTCEDRWAIDLTVVDINRKNYAVWSGWEHYHTSETEFIPQNLYIAEMLSPIEIGTRHLLAEPTFDWHMSDASLLEGPQAFYLDNSFKGLTYCSNASWTKGYTTGFLRYDGGDPLDKQSWFMHPEPMLPLNQGVGHGIIVEDTDLYFVGHRKTTDQHTWDDRMVFLSRLDRKEINRYLK